MFWAGVTAGCLALAAFWATRPGPLSDSQRASLALDCLPAELAERVRSRLPADFPRVSLPSLGASQRKRELHRFLGRVLGRSFAGEAGSVLAELARRDADLLASILQETVQGTPAMRRAALVLLSLPAEISARMFRDLGPEHVQLVVQVITCLPSLGPEQREAELLQFLQALQPQASSEGVSEQIQAWAVEHPQKVVEALKVALTLTTF